MKAWLFWAAGILLAALVLLAMFGRARAEDVMVSMVLTCLPAEATAEILTGYGLALVNSYRDGYGQSRERWEAPDGSDWAEVGLVRLEGARGEWRCIVAAKVPVGDSS